MGLLWLAGKITFYGAMAALAISMLRLWVASPVRFIAAYTTLRFVLGLAMGLVIMTAYAGVSKGTGEVMSYLLSFGVIRYVEWLAVLFVISLRQRTSILQLGWRGQLWILIGIAGNILLDWIAVRAVLPGIKLYC